jgi:meiotically up-regulated gene 157 (Mug157) protein
VDRLYRATIFSEHETTVSSGDDGSTDIVTGSIELLALARSPDDLRNTLRAAKEKYGAPTAAVAMER